MLYPFPMVSEPIIMAEESSVTCTFDVMVFGFANTPFTNSEPGEITTVFAVPFIPTVTFPDEVGIATLLVPLEIALPACAGKFVKRLPSPIKYEPATLPVTDNAVSVPKDVILACDAPVTVAADPVTEPLMAFVTVKLPSVPTLVMLVCAAVVSVPAILVNTALVAPILPTVALPVTFSNPPVLKLPALTLPL